MSSIDPEDIREGTVVYDQMGYPHEILYVEDDLVTVVPTEPESLQYSKKQILDLFYY